MKTTYKLLIFSVILVSLKPVSAQEIEWQIAIGGSSHDFMYSFNMTSDGGFICGGTSDSDISGDKSENSRGGFDYWVVKLDSAGNVQWDKTIGGTGEEELKSIMQTSDGGYICGGSSTSGISGDKTEASAGGNDYWIVKLDSGGNIQWQNTIGGNSEDRFCMIEQTSDGGFICGGWSYSGLSGDKSEISQGLNDYWIVKLDSMGNIQWQNTIGGTGYDILFAVKQTSDGGYICGGQSDSNISGDKTENRMGTHDYWVVKLDSNGNIQWQNTIGGNYDDRLQCLQQTTDGGFICGGYSESDISGDKTEGSTTGGDYWVVKLDNNGNIQWQNTIGGNGGESVYSILQTADDGYLCGGFSSSGISGDKTEVCQGYWDYWVLKLDSAGNLQWQNTIGGDNVDYLYTVQFTSDGSYALGGTSQSGITGDKTVNSLGLSDFWIIKISGRYNLIQGIAFADFDADNLQDAGEPGIAYNKIIESNTGRIAFTDANGFYSLSVLDSGNYQVSPDGIIYYNAIPSVHSAVFTGIQQTDSINDFAFQPTGTFNDLCVTITPTSLFRSGMNATYRISYINLGTTTLSPTVVFYPDQNISFISADLIPTAIHPDSVTFMPGPLAPFQSGQIFVVVLVDTALTIGTQINSGATVFPLIGDSDPSCNSSFWEVLITGAFDPNDILVNRNSLFITEFPTPPFLEYIIRFQNTGNDTAFYVRIENKISNDLQLNTFDFVASSHSCNIEYQEYDSTMKFTFNNILLPDSNTNDPASHGFVRYRIKPQTYLTVGDSIRNSAGIYFDYNAPVLTNTAITEIILPTVIGEVNSDVNHRLGLYPNPARENLSVHIAGLNEGELTVELYNIYGQKIRLLYSGENLETTRHSNFDISNLRSGMYFIKVSGVISATKRFVRQ